MPSYNLAIEVQGDYWHANPTIFREKLTNTQYDRINKDKRKHTYLKNQYNFEILYLWECDIVSDAELCAKLIQKYIENEGVLENYHSFNYHVEDEQVVLNSKLIIPYQDMDVNEYKNLLIV